MASLYLGLLVLAELPQYTTQADSPSFLQALLLSSMISVVSFLGTRWCQEPSCSCNEYEAFTCFVPQWEDASGLVRRLFRNCFPQGLFPRSASQSRKRFMKWKDVTETSWHEGREGKIIFWAVGRIFTSCAIHNFFCRISFFSFCFSLNSIIFTERKETARAIQTGAQWAFFWTALCPSVLTWSSFS